MTATKEYNRFIKANRGQLAETIPIRKKTRKETSQMIQETRKNANKAYGIYQKETFGENSSLRTRLQKQNWKEFTTK